MKPVIETERLLLRTWIKSDVEPLTAINQDPKVMEYFPSTIDRDSTKQFIERMNQHFDKYHYTFFAVVRKDTNEFIGFVGIANVNFNAHFTPAVEIGWRLSSQHWGNGFAPEAAKAVLAYAFDVLKLPDIVSFTAKSNAKSRRVMEKIGLHHDPAGDFDHPKLSSDSPLCRHVLYRMKRASRICSWRYIAG
jgi:RimJ/RimL family protein N-acetyltransferase